MSINYTGLLMYDLPMKTAKDIKRYKRLRKYIISKGYYLLQESVYLINASTKEYIEKIEQEILLFSQADDSIRSLILTEDQFKKMKVLAGEETFIEKIMAAKVRVIEF